MGPRLSGCMSGMAPTSRRPGLRRKNSATTSHATWISGLWRTSSLALPRSRSPASSTMRNFPDHATTLSGTPACPGGLSACARLLAGPPMAGDGSGRCTRSADLPAPTAVVDAGAAGRANGANSACTVPVPDPHVSLDSGHPPKGSLPVPVTTEAPARRRGLLCWNGPNFAWEKDNPPCK